MKFAFDLATTGNAHGALWFWNEINQMVGVCGYDGMEIPFEDWTFNGGRGAAPICAEAIRTKYGSVGAYGDKLRAWGIKEGLSGLHISAHKILGTMLEYNIPAQAFYDRVTRLAEETIEVLEEAGSHELIFSPSPMCALANSVLGAAGMLDDYTPRMAQTIAAFAETAAKHGVRVSLRNEFWGLYRGEAIDELLALLPNTVCYSPDLAQLHIAGTDERAMVKKYAEAGRLACVCLNDTFFRDTEGLYKTPAPEFPQDGEHQRVYCTFGNGDVDIPGIYGELVAAGYDGWVVLQSKNAFNLEKTMMMMQAYCRNKLNSQGR